MVCTYLGRRLNEPLLFLTGRHQGYNTKWLLLIALSIRQQHTLGVRRFMDSIHFVVRY